MAKKVLVAMSGGVDSSAAALLLKKQGFECVGVNMKLFDRAQLVPGEQVGSCSSDADDARKVAEGLGIDFHFCDFSKTFREKVIEDFISTYESGGTPNPCIVCNKYLKFDALYDHAMKLGCDYIATGHYAHVIYNEETGLFELHASENKKKDQSYVLYNLSQEQLSHTIFPLTDMDKDEIRKLAEEAGISVASKKESEDICFIPDGDYAAFIKRQTGKTYEEGEFVDQTGKKLGVHKGIIHYTIGQRKGLGVAAGHPIYVVKKDMEKNQVILGENEDLMCSEFTVEQVNWCSSKVPAEPVTCEVCTRYQGRRVSAEIICTSDTTCTVHCFQPIRAISIGQSAVFYDNMKVLGGGRIKETVLSK